MKFQEKISAAAFVQKVKKKHDRVADIVFLSASVTHNLVERERRGAPPQSQRSMYREMIKEITSQKNNYSKSIKTIALIGKIF